MAWEWMKFLKWPFSLSENEEITLAFLIENTRSLLPLLKHELVVLRARCIRLQVTAESVFSSAAAESVDSSMEARSRLQPRHPERLCALIENWRDTELLYYAYSLRVDLIEGVFRELQEEVRTARSLSASPQFSTEQKALLGIGLEPKRFVQDLLLEAQKAVAGQRLTEYVKSVGCTQMPPQMELLIHRSFEEYLEILAKNLEKNQKERQKSVDRIAEEKRLRTTQEAGRLPPESFITEKREAIKGQSMKSPNSNRVFLIHGHDLFALRNAELLLRRINCEPVIFSRIPDKASRTNVEILEQYLPSCEAVVVLLTPDDEGRKRGTDVLEPRVRQNVLIEAGFAIISRRATSLIVALGDVSIPSDFDGINRIQASTWDGSTDLYLARELSSILGLPLDIRRL